MKINDIIPAINAKVICESEDDVEYTCEGLATVKHNKYGKAFITVLCKEAEEDGNEVK